jgi:uroporphyrinogen decarboxylase
MKENFFKTLMEKQAPLTRPPIWLMRQAGRYLPEYLEVRKSLNSFLDLCYNPKMAAKVTMQPIERFDFDAAIIFSDILVVLDILGLKVDFQENIGPIVEKITSAESLKIDKNLDKSLKVCEAIGEVKNLLPKNKPLIGFVGGPWTVINYIFADHSKKEKFEPLQRVIFENPDQIDEILKIVTEQTIIHLNNQIKAGVDAIQIFESWSGLLPEIEFSKYVIEPTKYIIENIKANYPDIPIIGFPKGAGYLYDQYINSLKIDIIGVDQFIPLGIMKQWQNKLVVQGNLNPLVLFASKDKIRAEVERIKDNLSAGPYIFNLGHGILPKTPIENVEYMIKIIRS